MPTPFLLCNRCLRDAKVHAAWTVNDGEAVCIRHAVIDFDIDDDMDEHELYEKIYSDLWESGFRNVY